MIVTSEAREVMQILYQNQGNNANYKYTSVTTLERAPEAEKNTPAALTSFCILTTT